MVFPLEGVLTMERQKHDERPRPASELTREEWLKITSDVVRVLRQISRPDIRIVRSNAIDTEIIVVFVNEDERDGGVIRGLRYDASSGNYDYQYSGTPEQFARDLVNMEMLEPGPDYPAQRGSIVWRDCGFGPGPRTIGEYDARFRSE